MRPATPDDEVAVFQMGDRTVYIVSGPPGRDADELRIRELERRLGELEKRVQ